MHPTETLYLKYDSRQGITEIIGIHKKYLVKCKPIDIIDFWCLSCGTSTEGSHSAFRHHFGYNTKITGISQSGQIDLLFSHDLRSEYGLYLDQFQSDKRNRKFCRNDEDTLLLRAFSGK